MSDSDIKKLSPLAFRLKIEQIHEWELRCTLEDYIKAGGDVKKLDPTSGLYKKYKELTAQQVEVTEDPTPDEDHMQAEKEFDETLKK